LAVHFQRLITFTAGEPPFANFELISFSMIVSPFEGDTCERADC
jgi:hypothetical protein